MTSNSGLDSQSLNRNNLPERLRTSGGGTRASALLDETAVLAHRAHLLARPVETATPAAAGLDVVYFDICGERYAIEARIVQETIRRPSITPVPNTPGLLQGIYNLRGEVLAVFDLRGLLNISSRPSIKEWLIVVGQERTEFGFMANTVSDVASLIMDSVSPATGADSVSGTFVRGVTAEAVSLLDSHALLDDTRLSIDISPTGVGN